MRTREEEVLEWPAMTVQLVWVRVDCWPPPYQCPNCWSLSRSPYTAKETSQM